MEEEQTLRDCAAEWLEELNYSIMLLNDARTEERLLILDEENVEIEKLLKEKEELLASLKKERRRLSTGVLCSEGVATLIAEFVCGEYGKMTKRWKAEDVRTLYCFALAIRADGFKWPYLTFAAMRTIGLRKLWDTLRSNKIKLAPYRQVARAIIGEFARVWDSYVQADETERFLDVDGGFEDKDKAGSILFTGIKTGGVEWFREVYLQSPLFCPIASAKWKARIQ